MTRLGSRVRGLALGAAVLVSVASAGVLAQSRIEYVPARHISSVQGADVYEAYCKVCHGPAARGNGPAATLLKVRPSDLSLIEARDGTFDAVHVMNHCGAIERDADSPMPDWGKILADVYADRNASHMAARNVTLYIYTLQRH